MRQPLFYTGPLPAHLQRMLSETKKEVDMTNQQTKPVVTEFPQPERITQAGTPATALHSLRSDRRPGDYESESCEAEDYSTDRRPEWQKIASRGGRSRPNRKR